MLNVPLHLHHRESVPQTFKNLRTERRERRRQQAAELILSDLRQRPERRRTPRVAHEET